MIVCSQMSGEAEAQQEQIQPSLVQEELASTNATIEAITDTTKDDTIAAATQDPEQEDFADDNNDDDVAVGESSGNLDAKAAETVVEPSTDPAVEVEPNANVNADANPLSVDITAMERTADATPSIVATSTVSREQGNPEANISTTTTLDDITGPSVLTSKAAVLDVKTSYPQQKENSIIISPVLHEIKNKASNTGSSFALKDRNCVLYNNFSLENFHEGSKSNVLLLDYLHVMAMYYKLLGNRSIQQVTDVPNEMLDRIVRLIEHGKQFELAGLKDVPTPFMRSKGQFLLLLNEREQTYKVLSSEEAKSKIAEVFVAVYNSDVIKSIDADISPFKEFKSYSTKAASQFSSVETVPLVHDALLLACDDSHSSMIVDLPAGNKTIFQLASSQVTSASTTCKLRALAALTVLNGIFSIDTSSSTLSTGRLLVRDQSTNDSSNLRWKTLCLESAIEFVSVFVYEVYLDKEPHQPHLAVVASLDNSTMHPPSKEPVPEPMEQDVLFGRGGMTNAHPGNRRFRDIIALHRPDYIRAVKMDKPAVARKIVRAIRQGNPPGRFLRRDDNGLWFDVGDRTAAEKTSQGLRERTNAEKRQRSAMREALRVRQKDLDDDQSGPVAKSLSTFNNEATSSVPISISVPVKRHVASAPPLGMPSASMSISKQTHLNTPAPTLVPLKETAPNSSKKHGVKQDDLGGIDTAGLPPNAVDSEGNILVTDYDILCGRGGLTNHHKGNKRFRDIVALHRPDYVRASKIQKPSVARVIVRAIRNGDPPGRFLRKSESGKWEDIGDKKAAEKTSQALREKPNDDSESGKREPSADLAILLPKATNYSSPASNDAKRLRLNSEYTAIAARPPSMVTNTMEGNALGIGSSAIVTPLVQATTTAPTSSKQSDLTPSISSIALQNPIKKEPSSKNDNFSTAETPKVAIIVDHDASALPTDTKSEPIDEEAAAAFAAAKAAEVVAASIGEQIIGGSAEV